MVLKIPLTDVLLHQEGRGFAGAIIYGIEVETLLKQRNWHGNSFPLMATFQVEKIGEAKNPGGQKFTQVEIRNNLIWVKLRFDASKDLDSRFKDVLAVTTIEEFKRSEYFRKEIFDALDPEIFVGPLAKLSFGVKLALLEFVHFNKSGVTAETYKGRSYISVEMPDDGDVYNSLRLDQAARVARVINEHLLGAIKTFGDIADTVGIDGVKLVAVIQHKSFLDEVARPTKDRLEIYVPLEKAKQFKEAEITSQQLMDGSTILLNNNRIQAVLSSSAG